MVVVVVVTVVGVVLALDGSGGLTTVVSAYNLFNTSSDGTGSPGCSCWKRSMRWSEASLSGE